VARIAVQPDFTRSLSFRGEEGCGCHGSASACGYYRGVEVHYDVSEVSRCFDLQVVVACYIEEVAGCLVGNRGKLTWRWVVWSTRGNAVPRVSPARPTQPMGREQISSSSGRRSSYPKCGHCKVESDSHLYNLQDDNNNDSYTPAHPNDDSLKYKLLCSAHPPSLLNARDKGRLAPSPLLSPSRRWTSDSALLPRKTTKDHEFKGRNRMVT
jgi:hypothetical protein